MKIVDLSSHQIITDFSLFRSLFDGYYIKVTEGNYYVSSIWRKQHDNLGGKPRAPYHFMGNRSDISGQVTDFINQYSQTDWEWGPVLDAEFDTGDPTSVDIKNWVAEWRRQSGKYLIYVYLGRNTWLTTAPPNDWADSGTRIIGARYVTDDYNNAFTNFGLSHPNLDGVQYWDKGIVPGLNGYIDLNNFNQIVVDQKQPVKKKTSPLLIGSINA